MSATVITLGAPSTRMDSTSGLTVADDSPIVARVAEKMRALAVMKPALVRLLEWELDRAARKCLAFQPRSRTASSHRQQDRRNERSEQYSRGD